MSSATDVPDFGPGDDNEGKLPGPECPASPPTGQVPRALPTYQRTDAGIVWVRRGRHGEPERVSLSNFVARIVERVVVDDGNETASLFKIEALVDGMTETFTIPAKQFASLLWIEEKLGPRAIVEPGYQMRDQLRAAIQHLSPDIATATVYRHVGWREIGGAWVYLTAEGALGVSGPIPAVAVEPPDALRVLQLPSEDDPAQTRWRSRRLTHFCSARVIHSPRAAPGASLSR